MAWQRFGAHMWDSDTGTLVNDAGDAIGTYRSPEEAQKAVGYDDMSFEDRANANEQQFIDKSGLRDLTRYTGQAQTGGSIYSGTQNGIGGANSNWAINPRTGKLEPAIAGPGGYYLASDLIRKYGSVENAGTAVPNNINNDGPGFSWTAATGSNDFLSGKDGLADALQIAGMAAVPWTAGLSGATGTAGAAAGTAGFEGGTAGAFGAGQAGAGTLGAVGGDAAGYAGTGTDALTGGAGTQTGAGMDDWWTDLGLTSADVGMDSTPFTTNPSYADLGGNIGSSAGSDWADFAKQMGPKFLGALGRLAPGLLGAYGANKQTGALQNLAGQYANYGAPSRARYEASMAPGFDPSSIPGYSGAVDTASKSLLARLSATGGNPFGNPGGLIDANKQIISGTALPAVQEYQRLNGSTGFGTSLTAAGGFGSQAIGAQGNVYNAIGAGINDVINPPQTLAQQLADLRKSGLYSPNGLQ